MTTPAGPSPSPRGPDFAGTMAGLIQAGQLTTDTDRAVGGPDRLAPIVTADMPGMIAKNAPGSRVEVPRDHRILLGRIALALPLVPNTRWVEPSRLTPRQEARVNRNTRVALAEETGPGIRRRVAVRIAKILGFGRLERQRQAREARFNLVPSMRDPLARDPFNTHNIQQQRPSRREQWYTRVTVPDPRAPASGRGSGRRIPAPREKWRAPRKYAGRRSVVAAEYVIRQNPKRNGPALLRPTRRTRGGRPANYVGPRP